MNIVIIYGSVRKEREGIRAARFVQKMVEQRGHEARLIDPLEYPLPLLDKTFKEHGEGEAPLAMRQLHQIFSDADGFLVVASEYNHSIPSVLKNMIDHFSHEYFWKPSGIIGVSAGPFGGVRAAMALRVILPEVGMPTIPALFPVSAVQASFDEVGNALEKSYERRIQKFLDEFEWYVRACKAEREKGTPY